MVTPYDEVAALMLAPLGSSATLNALTTLRRAALHGEFGAAKALGLALAEELGLADRGLTVGTESPETFLLDTESPAIARVYALGYVPRVFLMNMPTLAEVWSDDQVGTAFPRFQQLIRRDSFLQDEVLKAFLLNAIVSPADTTRAQFRYSKPLGQIVREAKIVPGANMDTKFEVGRDLVLRVERMELLYFGIFHELGHYLYDILPLMVTDTAIGSAEDIAALGTVVAPLMAAAAQHTGAIEAQDPRRHRLPSGVQIICTSEQVAGDDGPHIHVSLSASGGPLELSAVALYAWSWLSILGVAPDDVVAVHSAAGIFHFGFLTTSIRSPEARAEMVDSDAVGAVEWIGRLRASGRLRTNEIDMPAILHGREPPTRIYTGWAQNVDDLRLLGGFMATDDVAALPEDLMTRLTDAAIRCADVLALRRIRESGTDIVDGDGRLRVGLGQLGACSGVVRDNDVDHHVGATASGVRAMIVELHDSGADINEALDEDGATLLTNAALRGPDFVSLLLANGADVNRANRSRETPLLLSVASGHRASVSQLLAAGAALDVADADGRTPIMMAASAELVSLLCDAGCDVDAVDHDRRTAVMRAAEAGRVDVLEELLRRGADPDMATDDGTTALHLAMWVNDADRRGRIVAALAAAGAEIDEPTDDGTTAVMIAAAREHDDTVAQLSALGATIDEAAR